MKLKSACFAIIGALVSSGLIAGCLGDLKVSETEPGAGGASGSSTGSAAGEAGAGGMMFCVPGSTTQCNTGMLGICADGKATCDADGKLFSPCEIVVQPSFDDCRTPEDEDCDGTAIAQCTGAIDWTVSRPGAISSPADDSIFGVAVVPTGGYVVTGFIDGDLASGGVVGIGKLYVGKTDFAGTKQWERAFAVSGHATGRAIAADSAGNVVVVGEFKGNGSIDGIPLTSVSNSRDILIARFDPMGTATWAKLFGTSSDDVGTSVTIDAAGDIIFTGVARGGVIDFGGGKFDVNGDDVIIAKFAPTGIHKWSKAFINGGNQEGRAVTTTKSGDVIIAGDAENSYNLGGAPHASGGGFDVFLARYSGVDGAYQWSKSIKGPTDQFVRGMAISANDEIFLTGRFSTSIDFGGQIYPATGAVDGYLAQFDASTGAHVQSMRFGAGGSIFPQAMAIDGAGHVYIEGSFDGQLGLGAMPLASTDGTDEFTAKLETKTWAPLWVRRSGNADQQFGHAVAVGPIGRAITGGAFKNELTGTIPSDTLMATFGFDMFLRRLDP